MSHTAKLNTTVPAIIARNSPKQMPNKSCGRRPTVEANEEIPLVALAGSVKSVFGSFEFM